MAKRPRMGPIRALLWEQWRRTRWVLLAPLVIAVVGTASALLADWLWTSHVEATGRIIRPSRNTWLRFAHGWVGLAWLLYAYAALLLSFSYKHHHPLPVKTSLSAGLHLGYRSVALALLVAILTGLTHLTPRISEDLYRAERAAFILVPLFFLLGQAVFFTLGQIRPGAVFLGFMLLPLFVCSLMWNHLPDLPSRMLGDLMLPTLAFVVLCITIAIFGAVLERRGFWASLRNLSPSLSIPSLGRKPQRFASDMHAQYWLERRQLRFILPIITACCVAFTLVPVLLTFRAAQDPEWRHPDQTLVAVIALAATAVIPGFVAFAVYNSNTLSPFVLTHAISTRSLVVLRLLTALRTALTAYALVFVGFAAYLAFTGNTPECLVSIARLLDQDLPALALLHLALLGHFAVVWAVLCWPIPVILTGMTLFVLFLPAQFFRIGFDTCVTAALAFVSALLAFLMIWIWAKRDGFRFLGVAKTGLLGAAMAAAVWTLLYHILESRPRYPHDTGEILLWLAFSVFLPLVCLAPLTIMPDCVHCDRHEGVGLQKTETNRDG